MSCRPVAARPGCPGSYGDHRLASGARHLRCDLAAGAVEIEDAAGLALMHDVNDRRICGARAGQHPAGFGQGIGDARQRHGAGDIFHLAIDQDEGGIGKRVRRHIGAGHFQQGHRLAHDFSPFS